MPDNDKRPADRAEWANTTSTRMIAVAKDGNRDSWWDIVQVYAPLVLFWCRQRGLCGPRCHAAQEVVWEVFETARKRIPTFTKGGKPGAFRCWLKKITHYKVLEYFRRNLHEPLGFGGSGSWIGEVPDKRASPGEEPSDIVDVDAIDIAAAPEDDNDKPLRLRRLLELIRPEFEPRTWEAFWRVAAEGRSSKDVAEELGMTVPAVHTAKCRVLKRLREKAKALGFYHAEGDGAAADIVVSAQREVTS